jgi:hypothetical protein
MKTRTKYILYLVVVFSIFTAVEYFRPSPIDWSPSFSKGDKIPYGAYILYNLLPDLFPEKKIAVSNQPSYNTLKTDSLSPGNYIIISRFFDPGKLDISWLLSYAEAGNFVFIAAEEFSRPASNTFNLRTSSRFPLDFHSDSTGIFFSDSVKRKNYTFNKDAADYYFTRYDTSNTTVLGYNSRWEPNFIFTRRGEGGFYFSAVPLAFVNYHLLRDNHDEYASHALSYLPVRNTYWDEYYKPMRIDFNSPLQYILSVESLKWTYMITITGILLYMIFEGKRRQRTVPVISPPVNTNLAFVESVGMLYFAKRSDISIGLKMIKMFKSRIRTDFNIDPAEYNIKLYEELSYRTHMEVKALQELFGVISFVELSHSINGEELIELSSHINNFYKQMKK